MLSTPRLPSKCVTFPDDHHVRDLAAVLWIYGRRVVTENGVAWSMDCIMYPMLCIQWNCSPAFFSAHWSLLVGENSGWSDWYSTCNFIIHHRTYFYLVINHYASLAWRQFAIQVDENCVSLLEHIWNWPAVKASRIFPNSSWIRVIKLSLSLWGMLSSHSDCDPKMSNRVRLDLSYQVRMSWTRVHKYRSKNCILWWDLVVQRR